MDLIKDFLSADHRRCDELFTIAEGVADKKDWEAIKEVTERYIRAMKHHFAMEEEVLFPEFESTTGQTMGPTHIMKMEHAQMTALFPNLLEAANKKDRKAFLGVSDTLLIMTQQHNTKEEHILYTMSDQLLASQTSQLIEQMKKIEE